MPVPQTKFPLVSCSEFSIHKCSYTFSLRNFTCWKTYLIGTWHFKNQPKSHQLSVVAFPLFHLKKCFQSLKSSSYFTLYHWQCILHWLPAFHPPSLPFPPLPSPLCLFLSLSFHPSPADNRWVAQCFHPTFRVYNTVILSYIQSLSPEGGYSCPILLRKHPRPTLGNGALCSATWLAR